HDNQLVVLRRRIGVRIAFDPGKSHDRLLAAGMVEECAIAFLHRTDMNQCLRVADAIPDGAPIPLQIRKRVAGRLRLENPVARHQVAPGLPAASRRSISMTPFTRRTALSTLARWVRLSTSTKMLPNTVPSLVWMSAERMLVPLWLMACMMSA